MHLGHSTKPHFKQMRHNNSWNENMTHSIRNHFLYTHMHYKDFAYEWRTISRNGHGQSGWSPIGCEGLYFHAMCKSRVSVSGWFRIGCDSFHTNLNIPSPLPTTLRVTRMHAWSMAEPFRNLWKSRIAPLNLCC